MSALWDCFEICINCFQGFLMVFFPFKYLGGRISDSFTKNHGPLFSILFTAAISVFNRITYFEHFYIVFYILILLIYSILYLSGDLPNKLFASVFPLLISSAISAMVAGICSILFNKTFKEILSYPDIERAIGIIITQLLIFYFIILSLKIFAHNKENSYRLSKREWFVVSTTFILSMMVGAFLCLIALDNISFKSRIYIALGLISIVLMNLVSFYLIIDLGRKNLSVVENEKLKLQVTYNKQYVENADIEFNLIQKLRHDSKAVYQVLDDYLLNGDIDKARDYLRSLADLADERIIFVNTSNDVANSIINAKLTVAKSFGIHTTCMSVKNFNGIEDLDLCRLLSNMLDNAITATSSNDNPDKKLSLLITEESGTYKFLVKNSIKESVLKTNPNLITTKKNRNSNGYGTRIIKDIAKKYNGRCEFYEKDSEFCCAVILNI